MKRKKEKWAVFKTGLRREEEKKKGIKEGEIKTHQPRKRDEKLALFF